MSEHSSNDARGTLYALLAYGAWGVLPAYWKLLGQIPVANMLSLRIVGSAICGVALLFLLHRSSELTRILSTPRTRRVLLLTAVLLAANWLLYLWSVLEGRIVEASLGYYITPLANVAWGVLGDKEHLHRHQWVAFGFAGVGVAVMAFDLGMPPWISLLLAASFSTYGFVRKRAQVSALAGQTSEALLLMLPATLSFFVLGGGFGGAEQTTLGLWLITLAGPVTIAPLIWFAAAAKALPYSKLGIFQYIAPTLQLVLAVAVYGEAFGPARATTFLFILTAIVVYVGGNLRLRRGVRPTRANPRPGVR